MITESVCFWLSGLYILLEYGLVYAVIDICISTNMEALAKPFVPGAGGITVNFILSLNSCEKGKKPSLLFVSAVNEPTFDTPTDVRGCGLDTTLVFAGAIGSHPLSAQN